jgi:MYXO-CTERM domain-containing protein
MTRWSPRGLVPLLAALLVSCLSPTVDPDPLGRERRGLTHSFDLAQHLPPRLAIMFAMSWFGLKSTDPSVTAPDPSYGNWTWSTSNCGGLAGDAHVCALYQGTYQRAIASRGRPLAGVYSSAGRDEESARRIDLMLSTIRRPCDEGARLDAFAIQLNGLRNTSLHPGNPPAASAELPYQALTHWLERADAAGLENAVMLAMDATWYYHFPSAAGLDCAGDPQSCADQIAADIVDMLQLVAPHPSALRVNGQPLILFYEDAGTIAPGLWAGIFQQARDHGGADFYTLGTKSSSAATAATLFDAFDALAPWIELGVWDGASTTPVRTLAASYAQSLHQGARTAVASHPGRVVFAGVHPGFNDFTESWGACTARTVPAAGQGVGPRDPDFLDGMMDWVVSTGGFQGVLLATWDDWTEGSYFEPDVIDGPDRLVRLRNRLGELYGDAADAAGETRLRDRWTGYGVVRGCNGTTLTGAPPGPGVPDLACARVGDGGVPPADAAPAADADQSSDGGAPPDGRVADGAAGDGAPDAEGGGTAVSGCACRASGAGPGGVVALGAVVAAMVRRRRRFTGGMPGAARRGTPGRASAAWGTSSAPGAHADSGGVLRVGWPRRAPA